METRVGIKMLRLFVLLLCLAACGSEEQGSVRLVFNVADGAQNANLLTDPSFLELEIVIEGDALPVPMRQVFSANLGSARISNLPVGENYRVSVFGLYSADSGMTGAGFFGASGAFHVQSGEMLVLPIQLGRSDCIAANNVVPLDPNGAGNYDLNEARSGFATAVLDDGRILVIGGGQVDETPRVNAPSATIEIYDPVFGGFTMADYRLNTARAYHTATSLPDGSVLVYGGVTGDNAGAVATDAELIFPDGAVPVVPIALPDAELPRYHHEAILLAKDQSVLLVGGYDSAHNLTDTVYRYFPTTREFVRQGPLSSPRAFGALGELSIGGYPAAYVGGRTNNALETSIELFSTLELQGDGENGPGCNDGSQPGTGYGCFVVYKRLEVPRSHFSMLTTSNGFELLMIGGYIDFVGAQTTNSIERFRQDASGSLVVERIDDMPFSAAELAAHPVQPVPGVRRGLQTYLVAGGRTDVSVSNGSLRIEESERVPGMPTTYVLTSLANECRLPEARTSLEMVGGDNAPLLVLGGHRYDSGRGWVATRRAEVYFPSFKAVIGQ